MKRFLLLSSFVVLGALTYLPASAHADEPPPAPSVAAAPAPVPAVPAVGKSDLDDELPPDVRAKLSPSELKEVMVARAQSSAAQPKSSVEVIVPAAFFLLVFLIVAGSLYANYRKEALRHETLRRAIERGASIPTELLVAQRAPNADLRRGLILTSLGIALAILLGATNGFSNGAWTSALIPLFLGCAYLLVHKLDARNRQDTAAPPEAGAYRSPAA